MNCRSRCTIGSNEKHGAAEEAYQLASARILLVDYAALEADFACLTPTNLTERNPELLSMPGAERRRAIRCITDQWLLVNAGIVSKAQLAKTQVNTEINIRDEVRPILRPPRYGRACVLATQPICTRVSGFSRPISVNSTGELDVKGVGVGNEIVPARGDYSDGLMSLKSALQEFLIQRLLSSILAHAKLRVSTLPVYAVIDTGFDGYTSTNRRFPAGLVARRAHLRDPLSDLPRWNSPDHYALFDIEMQLRRYGITSAKRNTLRISDVGGRLRAHEWGEETQHSDDLLRKLLANLDIETPFEADRVNVQMDFNADRNAIGNQIVDFGQYAARREFVRPVVSLVRDMPLAWGGMITPDDRSFVQPDPDLMPKGEAWRLACEPKEELFGAFAEKTVTDWRSGRIDANDALSLARRVLSEMTLPPKDTHS